MLPSFADVERLVFEKKGSPFSRAFTPDGTCHFKRGSTTSSEPPIARRNTAWSSLLCGHGKGDNQNHALVFCRGEVLQCIDANQDSYAETVRMAASPLTRAEESNPSRTHHRR